MKFAFAFDRGCIDILEPGQREQQRYPKRQLAFDMGRFGRLNSGKPHCNVFLHPEIRVPWRFAKSVRPCDFGG